MCVDDGNNLLCGTMMPSGLSCPCHDGVQPAKTPSSPLAPSPAPGSPPAPPSAPGSPPSSLANTDSEDACCATDCAGGPPKDLGARRRVLLGIGSLPSISLANVLPGTNVGSALAASTAVGGAARQLMNTCDCTKCSSESATQELSPASQSTLDKLQTSIHTPVPCPAGKSGPDDGPCIGCSAGKYKSFPGSGACADCGAGTYSIKVGAISEDVCQACPANSMSESGSSVCSCRAGFTGSEGNCATCEPGKFKDSPGVQSCSDCKAGTYSASGAVACKNCGADSISVAGSAECMCAAGLEIVYFHMLSIFAVSVNFCTTQTHIPTNVYAFVVGE